MARWLTRIAVCLLLIGQISAVSEPDRAFRDARTAACQSQQKLSHRLDAIEENGKQSLCLPLLRLYYSTHPLLLSFSSSSTPKGSSHVSSRLCALLLSVFLHRQRVQDTVWKLESEMSVLLDTIQDPDWSFHPSTDSAAVDMLDESPQS